MPILGDVGAKAGEGKPINRCIQLDAKSLHACKVKFLVQLNTPFYLPLAQVFAPGSPRTIYAERLTIFFSDMQEVTESRRR